MCHMQDSIAAHESRAVGWEKTTIYVDNVDNK